MKGGMSACPKCGARRPTSKVWDTKTCPGCKKRQKEQDVARKGARGRRKYSEIFDED